MRPSAWGYLGLDHEDEAVVRRWHAVLTAYGENAGLELGEVYVDRNIDPAGLDRPGLAVLLEQVAAVDDGAVVLVPAAELLSSAVGVRAALEARIHAAGGRLVIAEVPDRGVPAVGGLFPYLVAV